MIFTLIKIGVILLILYLIAHELKDVWTTRKEIRKSEMEWDNWERIPGYWDVYIAERGGVKGWGGNLDSVEVTSMEGETEEIVNEPAIQKINPAHSIGHAH